MPIENPFRGRNSDMFPDFSESEQTTKDESELRGLNPEFYNLGVEAPKPSPTISQQRKLRNPEFVQGQDDDEQPEKEKPAPLSPDQR